MPDAPMSVAVVSDLGSDLGRALAKALVRRGMSVAGFEHETPSADLESVLGITADVSNSEDVIRAIAEISSRIGTPTLLINNAEVYPHKDILDETPQSFMDTVRINLGGAFNCCNAVLPEMVAGGRGRIVNVVTFADVLPVPMTAGYSVSKGAVRILTKTLVADLGNRFPGIVINDWIPGNHAPRAGVPDGIAPAMAAEWGASLALLHSPAINGMVFLRDQEFQPDKSLKQKLKDRVLGKRRAPVRLM